MSDTDTYKLRWRGRETEPCSLTEINRRLDEHEIGMGHEIRYQNQWITLEEFFQSMNRTVAPPSLSTAKPETTALATPTRDAVSPQRFNISLASPSDRISSRSPRSRLVFALLGIFIGFLGVHNFYARQWLTGLLQLLLTAATLLMGFGIIASWIWAMMEAIFVRKDGDGLKLI